MNEVTSSFAKDVKSINKLDQNRKYVLLGFFLVLFAISYIVGSMLTKQANNGAPTTGQNTSQTGQITSKPTTTLSLVPASKTLTVGKAETISVMLSGVPVTATDIVVTYDPEILTVSSVENGSVFQKLVRRKIENNRVVYSGSVNPAEKDNLIEGAVFSFKVTAKKPTSSTVMQFDPVDTLTAINGQNTLGSTLGATYTVVN